MGIQNPFGSAPHNPIPDISAGYGGIGDKLFGNGPQSAANAKHARDRAEADRQRAEETSRRIAALGEQIGQGGYDQGTQDNYYQTSTAGLDKGYYDASRGAAAQLARSGFGDSGLNTSIQSQGTQELGNARSSAMRASVAQATADRRNALQAQVNALEGSANIDSHLYNADAENAAALDARQNAFRNMLFKAGGMGVGALVGGIPGAAAGGAAAGAAMPTYSTPQMLGPDEMLDGDPSLAPEAPESGLRARAVGRGRGNRSGGY